MPISNEVLNQEKQEFLSKLKYPFSWFKIREIYNLDKNEQFANITPKVLQAFTIDTFCSHLKKNRPVRLKSIRGLDLYVDSAIKKLRAWEKKNGAEKQFLAMFEILSFLNEAGVEEDLCDTVTQTAMTELKMQNSNLRPNICVKSASIVQDVFSDCLSARLCRHFEFRF